MSEDRPIYRVAWGRDEMVRQLEELIARVERGEQFCAGLRLFKPDGTWEDIAIGGTEEEQAEVLANLRENYKKGN